MEAPGDAAAGGGGSPPGGSGGFDWLRPRLSGTTIVWRKAEVCGGEKTGRRFAAERQERACGEEGASCPEPTGSSRREPGGIQVIRVPETGTEKAGSIERGFAARREISSAPRVWTHCVKVPAGSVKICCIFYEKKEKFPLTIEGWYDILVHACAGKSHVLAEIPRRELR